MKRIRKRCPGCRRGYSGDWFVCCFCWAHVPVEECEQFPGQYLWERHHSYAALGVIDALRQTHSAERDLSGNHIGPTNRLSKFFP